jgi:hypothetical protein
MKSLKVEPEGDLADGGGEAVAGGADQEPLAGGVLFEAEAKAGGEPVSLPPALPIRDGGSEAGSQGRHKACSYGVGGRGEARPAGVGGAAGEVTAGLRAGRDG